MRGYFTFVSLMLGSAGFSLPVAAEQLRPPGAHADGMADSELEEPPADPLPSPVGASSLPKPVGASPQGAAEPDTSDEQTGAAEDPALLPVRSAEPAVAPSTVAPSNGAPNSPQLVALDMDQTRHAHRGFYIAIQIGGGYRSFGGSSEETNGEVSWRTSGGGVGILLSIGAAVVENLVLHADVLSGLIANPTLRSDNTTVKTEDALARLVGIGGGVTYFVMPINLYFGGSVLASQCSMDVNDTPFAESDWGLGAAISAGKQFWLGDEWAVDVGPIFHFASLDDKGGQGSVTAWTLSLMAGISLN